MNEISPEAGTNRLISQYTQMCRIRAFEDVAIKATREGRVLGLTHPYVGQEAIAVGVCANLRDDDVILSTHRGHGHALAKGADATAMMLELFGKVGGACRAKGGSMHIADFKAGMLGANGVVAANLPIGVGAAHAIKLQGSDRVVVCFFGDGAINRGPFLESLNWARIYNLPVLFVCEDNQYSATVRTDGLTAGEGINARAEALDISGLTIDGNDITAVDDAAGQLIGQMRGDGPRYLRAATYRLYGHTSIDTAPYRPEGEAEAAWAGEPLAVCRAKMLAAGMPEPRIDDIMDQAQAEMAGAEEQAIAAAIPEQAETFEDVQDIGSPSQEAHRW